MTQKKSRNLVCLLILCLIATPAWAAPVVWPVAGGGNGHAYDLIVTSLLWTEAKIDAEARGGHLATITSQAEQDFIEANFAPLPTPNTWIGFTDNEAFGGSEAGTNPTVGWVWITGEPFVFTNWDLAQNEPNNNHNGAEEDYGLIKSSFEWGDFNGQTFPQGAYVIEFPQVCGNQTVEGTEDCDDGNVDNGDGCSDACQFEPPLLKEPLQCQQAIGRAGRNFFNSTFAAHKKCLEKQLKGTLPLTTNCRGTPTGDTRTDDALTKAENRLHNQLSKCDGIILEGLGFPGQCADPDDQSFSVDNLTQCLHGLHTAEAQTILDVEYPLP